MEENGLIHIGLLKAWIGGVDVMNGDYLARWDTRKEGPLLYQL